MIFVVVSSMGKNEELLRQEWNKAITAATERCQEYLKYQGEFISSGTDTGRTTIEFWLLGTMEEAIVSLRKKSPAK